ncbi:MAG TPA: transcriptional regulator, partial [Streptosporangiaceae bacterium]|nr:transcriptional regulator [Streptosporangiaceae bacterium]
MSTARFDELIHAPTRLAIISLLPAAHWADIKYIRDEPGLSDSALSRQLTTLESAGYVEARSAQDPRASARAPQPASAQPAARHSSSTWRPSSKSSPGHSKTAAPGRPPRPPA